MKRNELVGLVVTALGAFAGCGDNSDFCGPGTTAMDGVCVPSSAPPTCTDGTILNAGTNTCDIDPASCQDGTVLINDKCQDPTAGLTIDVEEGAEPNGFNIGEASSAAAGVIAIKPIGMTSVIHGHITPFQDADGDGISDPDFDTFTVAVTAPTLLEVTADGVHGLLGAFIVSGDASGALAAYRRFGMNLTGDTSKRKVFLPVAGSYDITIGDTRSMFLDGNSPPAAGAGGAAGDATTEYFVSVTALDLPTPTPLTVDATGVATDAGTGATGFGLDDLKFYTVPMGVGFNDVTFNMPQNSANASVVVVNNGAFKRTSDESFDPFFGTPLPAEVLIGGVNPSDTTLIVGDFTWNYGPEAADYSLTVTTGTATALKTDGTSTVPVIEINSDPNIDGDPVNEFNLFFYDVAADGEIDGMKISWQHAVDGLLVDENLQTLAAFTGLSGDTWKNYKGLLRHPTAGRYYFAVYDPTGTAGTTTIVAASTITPFATPTAITLGTQTAAVTNNLFNSTPFTYDAGTTVPWQQYVGNGTATGPLTATFLDPATTFGRLDPLTINVAGGPTTAVAPDEIVPLFSETLAQGVAKGRILLDDTVTSYIVKVNTTTDTTTSSYQLTFDARKSPVAKTPFGSFGTITAAPTVLSPNTLAIGDKDFFLLNTTAGGLAKVIATPTGTIKPDIELVSLNADESPDVSEQTIGTGAETGTFAAHTGGWVAVQVNGVLAAATTGTFDISAQTASATTYTNSSPAVAFVSICTGGLNDVTMHPDDIFIPATDDGLSDPLAAPAGFTFFGASVGSLQVSTNGWLSFQTNQVNSQFLNVTMPTPDIPNAVIAPFWVDLENVEVCAKTVGSTMTVEWQADTLGNGDTVAFQVQLNGTTGVITFVYDTSQADTGDDATVGLEDFSGVNADLLGFNTTSTIVPGGAKRFTPN